MGGPHPGKACRVRWSEFEERQPRFAALGQEKLGGPGVVLVGTIRKDGTPRITPVEPLFWNGDLWLSMGLGTLKATDLLRDSRVLVHNVVASRDGRDGELKLRGRAVYDADPETNARAAGAIAETLGWRPEPGKFQLFRIDVEDVAFVRWDSDTNDQYLTRWPEGLEQVRRGTSATTNGPPEPHRELLDAE
jgi:hypothetical protein